MLSSETGGLIYLVCVMSVMCWLQCTSLVSHVHESGSNYSGTPLTWTVWGPGEVSRILISWVDLH